MSGSEIAWRVFGYVVASAGWLGYVTWRYKNQQFVRYEGIWAVILIVGLYMSSIMWPLMDRGGWWQIAGAALLMGTIMGLTLGVFPWALRKLNLPRFGRVSA